MNHEVVSGIVNSLPIDKMVAAPLLAAIKAQGQMSLAMAEFIENVGLDKEGNIRMVTFKYDEQSQITTPELDEQGKPKASSPINTQKRYIEAPFIAMTGIPNLAVENVNISFDLEVSTAEDDKSKTESNVSNKTSGGFKSFWSPVSVNTEFTGSVTHLSEQTRHTDTRAKYSFNVCARKQPAPEAFMRIIDAVTSAVATPTANAEHCKNNLIGEKNNSVDTDNTSPDKNAKSGDADTKK